MKKVVWGVTGGGDKLAETIQVMIDLKKLYASKVDIKVYLSKAGEQVVRSYRLANYLKANFGSILVEINSNSPFLSGALELGEFEFLLIAPASSNTVAKISTGIADTLLSNSAIMALKSFIPVYILPTDYREGLTVTKLPDGRELKLRIRKEDAANVKKLARMDDMHIIVRTEDIHQVFKKYFKLGKDN
ncbi:MAG: archaeoflavoprotein AfpA [Candidatus Bathyarchaeota archaeon]